MNIIRKGQISAPLQGKLNYNAWGSILTLADGTMISVWSGDRYAHICPFGRVLASRSADGGYTWTPPYTVLNTPLDDRDAGLFQSGDRLILTSFNNSRAQQRMYAERGKYPAEKRAFIESYLNLIRDEDYVTIIAFSGEQYEVEGCLSIPGEQVTTKRPMYVTVRAFNRDGEVVDYTGEGLLARAFCHELDHLDGKLMIDRAVPVKKKK